MTADVVLHLETMHCHLTKQYFLSSTVNTTPHTDTHVQQHSNDSAVADSSDH